MVDISSKNSFSIIDIRKTEISQTSLVNAIIDGLNPKQNSMKSIPTIVLYDDVGLQIYDQITYLEEYYLTNAEIDILKNKADQIIEYIPDGSHIIELGAG